MNREKERDAWCLGRNTLPGNIFMSIPVKRNISIVPKIKKKENFPLLFALQKKNHILFFLEILNLFFFYYHSLFFYLFNFFTLAVVTCPSSRWTQKKTQNLNKRKQKHPTPNTKIKICIHQKKKNRSLPINSMNFLPQLSSMQQSCWKNEYQPWLAAPVSCSRNLRILPVFFFLFFFLVQVFFVVGVNWKPNWNIFCFFDLNFFQRWFC